MKTLPLPKPQIESDESLEQRHWELFKVAYGALLSNVQFEEPHPDGGSCSISTKEILERCKAISLVAWNSASYAANLFEEAKTVDDFTSKCTHD
jgi:hypothetical protein